eukprot:CAMPEP_0204348874 /NCGR_PEP_ID=MMETSP0469-20131031/29072_1 /ASSEMBLY_ACC=CAM_ASM_000384 /TAXON_ID=2969 /ORGANISM="Oxyrrhis marina" /LENGTH=130 /DNA_ID=CAMNT_0051334941 /DNA_START=18 /DNA_END=410 /DNA_ORIENTATION=-
MLQRAASGGNRDVVRLLLYYKASAAARDRLGFSALHFATNQEIGMVKDLIVAEADVNCQNLQGISPLHSAAGMGRDDVCELLLASRASPAACAEGNTPSSKARRRNFHSLASTLEEVERRDGVGLFNLSA